MRFIVTIFCVLMSAAVHADDLPPRYDPVAWCDTVAKTSGAVSEMIKDGCMDQEQSSYDEIKSLWPTLPANIRKWCNQVAKSGGRGSYMILAGCIQQELESKSKNTGRDFKY